MPSGRDLSIGVSVRGRGIRRAAKDVRRVGGAVRATDTALRGARRGLVEYSTASRGMTGALGRARTAIRGMAGDTGLAQRGIHGLRRSVALMGDTWRRTAAGIGRSMPGGGTAGLVARWAGVAGAGAMVRRGVTVSAQLARLESDARGWEDPQWAPAVEKGIFSAADRWRVKVGEVIAGVNQVISDTGDRALALRSIEPIARAIQATGTGGQAIGMNVSGISGGYGIDPEVGLAVMAAIGSRGTVPARVSAREVGKVHGAFRKLGAFDGYNDFVQVSALFQSAAEQTGGAAGAAEAATAMESFGRLLVKPPEEWKQHGIRGGGGTPLIQTLEDIRRHAGGDPARAAELFPDIDALRAVLDIVSERGWEKYQGYLLRADQAVKEYEQAIAINIQTTQASLDRLSVALDRLSTTIEPLVRPVAALAAHTASNRAPTTGTHAALMALAAGWKRAKEWWQRQTEGVDDDVNPRRRRRRRNQGRGQTGIPRGQTGIPRGPSGGPRRLGPVGRAARLPGVAGLGMSVVGTGVALATGDDDWTSHAAGATGGALLGAGGMLLGGPGLSMVGAAIGDYVGREAVDWFRRATAADEIRGGDTIINVHIDGQTADDADLADEVAERIAAEQALQRQTAQHD